MVEREKKKKKKKKGQTGRQTVRQAHMQTGRQTDRQAHMQTQTDREGAEGGGGTRVRERTTPKTETAKRDDDRDNEKTETLRSGPLNGEDNRKDIYLIKMTGSSTGDWPFTS